MKNKMFLPIDINGIGLFEAIDDNIGEVLFDSLVIGDGNDDINCLFITLK
jgi:hypothetical protein